MSGTYSSQYREMVLAQVRAGRSVCDLAEGLNDATTKPQPPPESLTAGSHSGDISIP